MYIYTVFYYFPKTMKRTVTVSASKHLCISTVILFTEMKMSYSLYTMLSHINILLEIQLKKLIEAWIIIVLGCNEACIFFGTVILN